MTLPKFLLTLLSVCLSFTLAAQSLTRPLNDTGVEFCGAASSGNNTPCLGTDPLGQDYDYGRDFYLNIATKLGSSGTNSNGFDFSKIGNNGAVVTAVTNLGVNPTDWACTRDNVTGLIWEIKSVAGPRGMNHSYSWFKTATPDGNNGAPAATTGSPTCDQLGSCDTEKYVAQVNTMQLCGYNDWRLPTRKELFNILHLGTAAPFIDATYFPNTYSGRYWTSTPLALTSGGFLAWFVSTSTGTSDYASRSDANAIRLVRGN